MTLPHFARPARGTGKVLVVDDTAPVRRLLQSLLNEQGYEVVTASDGREALESLRRELPDVVLTDIHMPHCDGFQLCQELKDTPATRLIPLVLMTGAYDRDDRLRALNVGATDLLTKPVDPIELQARMRALMQFKRSVDDLESAEDMLRSLALMVEARDPDTAGHCQRLARYVTALGRHIGLPDEDLLALERGGYFHDIGKIALPDAILLKAGPLTPDERARVKEHTVMGDKLCSQLRTLQPVRAIVRSHHERLDGTGYPDGLRGDTIPLLAQIMAIVDVYDAMTTRRSYKPALSDERACQELHQDVHRGWRRQDLVEAFLAVRLSCLDRDP